VCSKGLIWGHLLPCVRSSKTSHISKQLGEMSYELYLKYLIWDRNMKFELTSSIIAGIPILEL
jgi:hypothetical protein